MDLTAVGPARGAPPAPSIETIIRVRAVLVIATRRMVDLTTAGDGDIGPGRDDPVC